MAISCFDGNQNRLTGSLIDVYNKNHRQHALKFVILVLRQMVELEEVRKKNQNIAVAAVACGHHAGYFPYFNSLKFHLNPRCSCTDEETEA